MAPPGPSTPATARWTAWSRPSTAPAPASARARSASTTAATAWSSTPPRPAPPPSFTLTNADGTDLLGGAAVRAGRDAAITLGADTIHSATNTFTDVVPGVDLTVSTAALGTTVEVNVARDGAKVKDSVKSLVDNVNALLTQIDSLTSYSSTSKGAAGR